jgi:hypothetical protein
MAAQAIPISVKIMSTGGCWRRTRSTSTYCMMLVLACAVWPAPLAMFAQPVSHWGPEAVRRMQKTYPEVTIEIAPEKPHFFQGEDISLRYLIRNPALVDSLWLSPDIEDGISLWTGGEMVDHLMFDIPGIIRYYPPVQSEYRGTVRLAEWGSQTSLDNFGFRHLLPGRYTGYFDRGIVSPEFEFDVDPVPDSLRASFQLLARVKNMTARGGGFHGDALSETARVMDEIVSLPTGGPYKSEITAAAIRVYWFNRNLWSSADSLLCVRLLNAMANDTTIKPASVITGAYNTIFNRLRGEQTIQAMNEFANAMGNPRLMEKVRRWTEEQARLQGAQK